MTRQGELIFFTDLDGTLLDHTTYRWDAARPALRELEQRRIPLVLVSSKTRAEDLFLLRELGRREPFIVENGGAIYFPVGYFSSEIAGATPAGGGWWRVELGTPYRRLVDELQAAARQASVRVLSFAQMSVGEVAELTELPPPEARRALQREYDEPFLILDSDAGARTRLSAAIRRRGLRATRGSRFFHILGANDKGLAVRHLTAWFRRERGDRWRSVGLGDSPNDVPLLRAVHLPILVARPGGRYDPETLAAVPGVRRAGGVGPAGWNRAVMRLLGEKRD